MDSGVLVITGATATGKSALAIAVAERIGAEIISMDSRQVYRGMDIGTAKVTAEERARVQHHGIDVVDPDERYSAGRFARDARTWLTDAQGRGRPALLVGGTGFFLRALTHPLFREPDLEPARAEALKQYLAGLPGERVREWAGYLADDTELPADRQRLARVIEVATLSGRTLDWWHRNAAPAAPPLDVPIVVLELPRDVLYRRIDARVTDMVEAGLVDETKRLRAAGYGLDDPGMNATGYPEMLAYLDGECTLDGAVEHTRAATRSYARRQETWFRHQLPDGTIRLDATKPAEALVQRVTGLLQGEEVRG